jgi:periplasmic copper chaperone A
MRQAPSFPVPAGGSLVFRTGANHLMLMGLKRKPMVGDIVTFVLHFATSAPITVRVPVRSATYP